LKSCAKAIRSRIGNDPHSRSRPGAAQAPGSAALRGPRRRCSSFAAGRRTAPASAGHAGRGAAGCAAPSRTEGARRVGVGSGQPCRAWHDPGSSQTERSSKNGAGQACPACGSAGSSHLRGASPWNSQRHRSAGWAQSAHGRHSRTRPVAETHHGC